MCVVGASAAGLAAALHAARGGASVVLLESKREIGLPAAPATLAFDHLWGASERPPAASVRRRLLGVRIVSPLDAGHALEVAAPLSILDRTRFDQHLASLAEQAGARIETGVAGLRVDAQRTLTRANGTSVRARVTIFADGARTLAQRFLRPTRDPTEIAWGAALEFEHAGAEVEEFVSITPGEHAPGGRAQTNPIEGERWTHWTFLRGAKAAENVEPLARASLALECRLRGWPVRDVMASAKLTAVAPDPVYTLPRELVADGVMVAGGAGGQGGLEVGVASGALAGAIAADAVREGDTSRSALLRYEREWKRRHLRGYRSLRRVADALARLDDAAIDRLLAPWAGWRVPVRDITGLVHPSAVRRAEAIAKFAMRNPHAVPTTAITGLRAAFSPRRRAE